MNTMLQARLTDRLIRCITEAEEAFDRMTQPGIPDPAAEFATTEASLIEAIDIAGQLNQQQPVEALSGRLVHVRAVRQAQLSS